MVPNAALLNTKHCKGKEVVAIEKGAFGSPSAMVANFISFFLL